MNTPMKLAAFAAVLAVSFGGAWLVGAAIDPLADRPAASHDQIDHGDSSETSGQELQR